MEESWFKRMYTQNINNPSDFMDAYYYNTYPDINGLVWRQPVINQITMTPYIDELRKGQLDILLEAANRQVPGISVDEAIEYLQVRGIEI